MLCNSDNAVSLEHETIVIKTILILLTQIQSIFDVHQVAIAL